jgi:DNA-directed RNA polymerase specialized sigma24 family protein
MEEDLHSDRQLSPSGRRGRKSNAAAGKGRDEFGVPGPLAEAAPGTWRAGLAYAARYLGDTALAAEVVEGVVHSAAKAHRNKPIKNPDSYLLSGIVRRVKKLLAREKRIEYRGSLEELEGLKGAWDTNWVAELDNRILVQELVGLMDTETRDLFFKWVRGDEWEEIAGDLGISVNAAQHRLRYGIEKARERVFQSTDAKPKPVPAPKYSECPSS